MVLGKRKLTKGMHTTFHENTQIATQAAAVTAVTYTAATGDIAAADTVVDLDTGDAAMALTIPHIEPGRILVITQVDAGTDGHTVTLTGTGCTFDGTNNTATINAQYEALVLLAISDKRFLILKNYGSVALSAV